MNRSSLILSMLLVLVFPVLAIPGQYKVIRVVDGDTIVIMYNGKYEKVRLLCVNTPESVHPDKKQNIPMGKVASKYTKKKLTAKHVKLEFEIDRLRGNHEIVKLQGKYEKEKRRRLHC